MYHKDGVNKGWVIIHEMSALGKQDLICMCTSNSHCSHSKLAI